MSLREGYGGPALLSYGFRPFFLSAALFALVVIPAWWLIWRGAIAPVGHFSPVDWHIHEMVFGYGAAVVAGFLFTAVPNWTGRIPTRGMPLMILLAVWVAGRLAVAGGSGLSPAAVAFIDQLFLLAVAGMIAREIVAGKNWRNLMVLVPVSLLWLANLLFHVEAMVNGSADFGRRLGIALLVFLILLIGGRIVPSFTRNWLVQRRAPRLPVAFNRFDALCLLAGGAGLIAWVTVPEGAVSTALGTVAAILHLARLVRWRGISTWASPLLLMLHLAYLMISLGFAAIALASFDLAGPEVPAHFLGIGAIGGMSVAVMMRATMGHTGRPLEAGRILTAAFVFVIAACAARVAGPSLRLGPFDGIDLSAALWTASFAMFAARIGPWLILPRAARKKPTSKAAS
ncbi:NnrS family protein [Allosediminivita pacifica]|uniref:Uncharacterized protein involved in response to NO n=1 Tax=Allosediminivita pacifica TaxID=1267769 RepID=A0A2T6AFW3_9RHOB|nr:NnrS family protein [Allosediminivita pacifica]PTX42713.1 uncharacterized protein involved in response to NO [Allosediminivita pacifica]GGB06380.1 short-chain dehydrogenase [Allosediminivita pacifica]